MTYIRKRKIVNNCLLGLSIFAALIGVFWLVFILTDVLIKGISSINLSLFIDDPAPPGINAGGLRSAFVGQAILTLVATAIGVPIGILGGTFIAEYGRHTKIGAVVSDISDIMMSFPSIVVGTFIYAVIVRPMGHFSGYAGAVSLAIIMIPIVLRTTEEMLKLIPWELREAAFALGAPYYKVIIQIVYRGAAMGLFTGVILSIARVAGETAPLLFTSFNNPFFTTNLNEPMPSLTVTIYQYAMGPYAQWHKMAWSASFIITITILLISIIGRWIIKRRYKH